MEMKPYEVYVKPDSNRYITKVDSTAFLTDTTGWVKIDEGYGDKYHHAQGNYFEKPVKTMGRACQYKLTDDDKAVECTAEEIAKQEEANKPAPAPAEPSVWDELDAAYQEGVDSV